MSQSKRVILRLREVDHDESDIYEPVRAYFTKTNRSVQELETNQYFVHIQPPNLESFQGDPKIHVIIDLEKDSFRGPLSSDFPHEFYRVRRSDSKLVIVEYKEGPSFENFKGKVRAITDEIYPWGRIKR